MHTCSRITTPSCLRCACSPRPGNTHTPQLTTLLCQGCCSNRPSFPTPCIIQTGSSQQQPVFPGCSHGPRLPTVWIHVNQEFPELALRWQLACGWSLIHWGHFTWWRNKTLGAENEVKPSASPCDTEWFCIDNWASISLMSRAWGVRQHRTVSKSGLLLDLNYYHQEARASSCQ